MINETQLTEADHDTIADVLDHLDRVDGYSRVTDLSCGPVRIWRNGEIESVHGPAGEW
jgi:hypothetical protein